MAFPLLLIPAITVGIGGIGVGIHGGVKIGEAAKTIEEANAQHEKNFERFRRQNVDTCQVMDTLGLLELDILKSFKSFSEVFEKLRDKPQFRYEHNTGVSLPAFNPEEIKQVSIGAVTTLNLLQSGVAGVASGFAAAGAVPAIIMSIGSASTGTAIATLSGQAATNSILAWLGGGSIATGGGGMALGTVVLGTATAGIGLLIGGVVFSIAGSSLSKKVEEAWEQVGVETVSVDKICSYFKELSEAGKKYYDALNKVRNIYTKQLRKLRHTVHVLEKTNFRSFTKTETINYQNTILLVQLLHEMCKVKLVLKNETQEDINTVNYVDVNENIVKSETVLNKLSSPNETAEDEFDTHINSLIAEIDSRLDEY